jgi:methyl-accepting chemotaxis protein
MHDLAQIAEENGAHANECQQDNRSLSEIKAKMSQLIARLMGKS